MTADFVTEGIRVSKQMHDAKNNGNNMASDNGLPDDLYDNIIDAADEFATEREPLGNRSDETAGQGPVPGSGPKGWEPGTDLYIDVCSLLDGDQMVLPEPDLLSRNDSHPIFYSGQVNCLFGDPDSGKSFIALAACVEALRAGKRVLYIDLDHNGAAAIIGRLLVQGAGRQRVTDRDVFRLAEPADSVMLNNVIRDQCGDRKDQSYAWNPAVAVVDSIGELMPMRGADSNSADDFTITHTRILKPLALSGAAVIAIDHLPKSLDGKASGPIGSGAKRRTMGGAVIRVVAGDRLTPVRAAPPSSR